MRKQKILSTRIFKYFEKRRGTPSVRPSNFSFRPVILDLRRGNVESSKTSINLSKHFNSIKARLRMFSVYYRKTRIMHIAGAYDAYEFGFPGHRPVIRTMYFRLLFLPFIREVNLPFICTFVLYVGKRRVAQRR